MENLTFNSRIRLAKKAVVNELLESKKTKTKFKKDLPPINREINSFVNDMLAIDSREFRKHYRRISPDVNTTFTYEENGYTEGGVNIPLSFVDMFFRE